MSFNVQLFEMKDIVLKLQEIGVGVHERVEKAEAPDESELPFRGMSFCFTGTREFTDVVESLGGKIASGVSKNTSFLVQKDKDKATAKSKKAAKLEITVLGLPEIKVMIENVSPESLV